MFLLLQFSIYLSILTSLLFSLVQHMISSYNDNNHDMTVMIKSFVPKNQGNINNLPSKSSIFCFAEVNSSSSRVVSSGMHIIFSCIRS